MFGEIIEPGQIIIKDVKVLRAILERHYSPLLIDIECGIAKEHGVIITEAYREPLHPGDVHTHMRAFDNRSWCYPDVVAYRIMEDINRKWQYDYQRPDKPCSIIHRGKSGEIHFHNQVHPNTRRRAI